MVRAADPHAMISRLNGGMTSNLLVMRVLVPLSPLLGLIGTVSGMLEVFDSMALRGRPMRARWPTACRTR